MNFCKIWLIVYLIYLISKAPSTEICQYYIYCLIQYMLTLSNDEIIFLAFLTILIIDIMCISR